MAFLSILIEAEYEGAVLQQFEHLNETSRVDMGILLPFLIDKLVLISDTNILVDLFVRLLNLIIVYICVNSS